MDPATKARAVGLARYANWLARKGTPAEQALTAAMLKRYSSDARAPTTPRSTPPMPMRCSPPPRRFPANDDVALLAAEAAMDTRPWDYWTGRQDSRSRGSARRCGWSRRVWRAIPTIRRPRISTST